MMRLLIFSRQLAEAKGVNDSNCTEKHVWIGAFDPEEGPPKLPENSLRADELFLGFHDIEPGCPGDFILMTEDHAKQIVDFMEKHKDVGLVCVNCEAGISRSSAIACAISLIFNGHDSNIEGNPRYFPNSHVKTLVLREAKQRSLSS